MKNLNIDFDKNIVTFINNSIEFEVELLTADISRKKYFELKGRMMIVNKVNYGFNVDTRDGIRYYAEMSNQGMIYKDCKAFESNSDEVCYISEYGFENNDDDNGCDEWCTYGRDSYTRKDIEKACESFNLNKKYAADVFETVDWQSPESYIDEIAENIEDYE